MQQLGTFLFSGDIMSPDLRARLLKIMGTTLTLIALGWAGDLHRKMGLVLYTEQFLAIILGLTIAFTFLLTSQKGDKSKGVLWYDALAAFLSITISVYIAVFFASLVNELSYSPVHLVVISSIIVLLVIEGLRRMVGWPLTIVILSFVLFGMFGHLIPGQLSGRQVSFSRLFLYLGLDSNGILGLPLIVGATIVIPFIFFGQILSKSGGSDFFTDLSVSLMGRFRGGSAKIAVVASALFGSISGSAVSNVATTGVITIPLMTKSGYRARVAAAIEAVASTGGQLMPLSWGRPPF
ncbi:MAG: TRAP transporter large permease subunit [Sneathiella sp.]|nr:TRAP transporter large permease subunit [Sneathiella sp.]